MFKDLKIIELASVLAGPSVGMFFAELGAEVLKIEAPFGDVTRSWKLNSEDPQLDTPAYFSSVNWGKKSIVLDFKKEQAKQHLYELIKTADIIITSYKPGDDIRLGVDYKTLKNIKKDIILGQITGYGPSSSRVGYDAIIQAEAGYMYMNGEPNSAPAKMPVALMDILTAHQLKEGLLCALINKLKTGEGALVECSLIQTGIASLANQATNYLNANHIPEQMGSEHPNIVPYGTVFKTKDLKHIILAVGSDNQFELLCQTLNFRFDPTLFASNPLRVKNRTELIPLLKEKISQCNSVNLLAKLEALKVPAGAVKNMEEVFNSSYGKKQLLKNDQKQGLRTIAFDSTFTSNIDLDLPPHLNK